MDIPVEMAIAGLGLAVALLVFALGSQAEERSVVRESLRQLDGYDSSQLVESVRDQELLNPLTQRTVAPILGLLKRLSDRFTPAGYVENIKRKHFAAGIGSAERVDKFLSIRVATVVAIVPAFWLLYIVNPLGQTGMAKNAMVGLVMLVLVLGPDAKLNRLVSARQDEIRRSLPDVLDLLVISVEAGLGFEQALDRVVASVPSALADEFGRALREMRAGLTRADALRAVDTRLDVPEVRGFILAILQADTFGVSIGRVLRAQADEMRIRRRQLAQEKAQKAPIKMLIPMVFCVFPALFVVVIGPAMINIMENF